MMESCDVDWVAMAAWIQAIGSVAAIVAAIVIGRRSDQRARDLVESERNRQGRMVVRAFGLKLAQLLNQLRHTRDQAPTFIDQLSDMESYAAVPKHQAVSLFRLENTDDLDRFRDQALLVDGDIGIFILDAIEVAKIHNAQVREAFESHSSDVVSAGDLIGIAESAFETSRNSLVFFENVAVAIKSTFPDMRSTL